MNEAIAMWRNPRMIVMTGIVAAIYSSAQIALAPLTIIVVPGVLLFRPTNILTMFLGITFGPAGAFGVAIGNVIGDYFTGGLGLGSFFGALAPFSIGYVGYTFWGHLLPLKKGKQSELCIYFGTGFVAAATSGVILGWGLQLLGLAPFAITSNTLVANFTLGNCLGYLLYSTTFQRIHSLRLTWADLTYSGNRMNHFYPKLGIFLISTGSIGGWLLGAFLSANWIIICFALLMITIGASLL